MVRQAPPCFNPRTAELIEHFPYHSPQQVQEVLAKAKQLATTWGNSSLKTRADLLRTIGVALRQNQLRLAHLATAEMGKLLPEANAELEKCAQLADYAADHVERDAFPTVNRSNSSRYASLRFRPLGTILGIMPWNYPFWQVARFVLPSLAAGNVKLLKHAPNVQRCAQAFTQVVQEAGEGYLLQHVHIDNEASAKLIASEVVKGVSLTGSTKAGRAVAATAGQHLKPSLLELWGVAIPTSCWQMQI